MSSANGITTYHGVKAVCLGCTVEMAYRTVDETASGVTIQVPIRYCDNCHKATLKALEVERVRMNDYARAHISAVSSIFDALRRTEGGRP